MRPKAEIEALFCSTLSKHEAMLRRICMAYSTPRIDAQDLFQEVMASVWIGLRSFQGKSALATWLYRVAINTCISYLRRTDPKVVFKSSMLEHDLPDNSMEGSKADDFACLQFLISQLGPLDKAIILMWLDERSYSDISEVTGLSINVVATRLNRIRTKLKKLWKTEEKGSTKE